MTEPPGPELPHTHPVDIDELAAALRVGVGLVVRRLREAPAEGELTMSERSALRRLERCGPTTSSALAKMEQISPQSMGATMSGLEIRGMVVRHPDPEDGRRVLLSVTEAALEEMSRRRTEHTATLARALAGGFTPEELVILAAAAPLIERLAEYI
jgi:DNA-binding MarR family transcriptional regulator